MLNHKLKKEALTRLQNAKERHDGRRDELVRAVVALHELRCQIYGDVIRDAEAYVSELAGAPRELVAAVGELRDEVERFDHRLTEIKKEDRAATVKAGSAAGAGVMAGAGVAAFGPSAAMAFAMTFGTASTGTMIGSLSGAAATNAALAYLGGGALAAGGGGMAAGNAFLALAGPVGWGIGAAALTGAGAYAFYKNKKIAEKANAAAAEIEGSNRRLVRAESEVRKTERLTRDHAQAARAHLAHLRDSAPRTHAAFNAAQKQEMMAFINNVRALGQLLAWAPSLS